MLRSVAPCSEVCGVLIGLSQVLVAVNGCLESIPQIRQVWGSVYLAVFVIYGLCHHDINNTNVVTQKDGYKAVNLRSDHLKIGLTCLLGSMAPHTPSVCL